MCYCVVVLNQKLFQLCFTYIGYFFNLPPKKWRKLGDILCIALSSGSVLKLLRTVMAPVREWHMEKQTINPINLKRAFIFISLTLFLTYLRTLTYWPTSFWGYSNEIWTVCIILHADLNFDLGHLWLTDLLCFLKLHLWNLDHIYSFVCKFELWVLYLDVLSCFLSYSIEKNIILHAHMNFYFEWQWFWPTDLPTDLLSAFYKQLLVV